MNQVRTDAGRSPGNHHARSAAGKFAAALGGVAQRLDEWRRRARSRQELMTLGADALKDIGVGRSEAYREYSKPFWRM